MSFMPERPKRANALGAFVRWQLDRSGMSPTELAAAAGMARSTVYKLIGDQPPETVSTAQLRALATALQVELNELVDLWNGEVTEVRTVVDERNALVHGFVHGNRDLTIDEMRAALAIADAAARLARMSREAAGEGEGDPRHKG